MSLSVQPYLFFHFQTLSFRLPERTPAPETQCRGCRAAGLAGWCWWFPQTPFPEFNDTLRKLAASKRDRRQRNKHAATKNSGKLLCGYNGSIISIRNSSPNNESSLIFSSGPGWWKVWWGFFVHKRNSSIRLNNWGSWRSWRLVLKHKTAPYLSPPESPRSQSDLRKRYLHFF